MYRFLFLIVASTLPSVAIAENSPAGLAGLASVYSKNYAGSKAASGEINRLGAMTAAHRTLPFGTQVAVTNKRNGKTVVVRVNDRGPFIAGRVIDLSPAAADSIGVSGLAPVSLVVQP
jgi:rare lipoprotein A